MSNKNEVKTIPDFVRGIGSFCPKDCQKFDICIIDGQYSCLNIDICNEAVRGFKQHLSNNGIRGF